MLDDGGQDSNKECLDLDREGLDLEDASDAVGVSGQVLKEGLDWEDQDEKKKLEELKAEFEPLT